MSCGGALKKIAYLRKLSRMRLIDLGEGVSRENKEKDKSGTLQVVSEPELKHWAYRPQCWNMLLSEILIL